MKNFLNPRRFATFSVVKKTGSRLVEVRLVAGLAVSLAVISVVPQMVSQAQGSYVPSRVSNVSAQPSASGTIVSIAADSPLSRAQNWQDSEGYHLVFPNTVPADSLKAARGVRVRRVGTSLEVLLQTKPGSKVSVHPDGNHVNLVVDKKLEARTLDGDSGYEPNSSQEQQLFHDSQQSRQTRLDSAPTDASSNSRSSS